MNNERRKMLAGELYDPFDAELVAARTSRAREAGDGMQWWFDVRADSQRYGGGETGKHGQQHKRR